MATKRMFNRNIIKETDFITLSLEAKTLYFLLNLEADDNGFTQPYHILELYKINGDALFELAQAKYITLFMKMEHEGEEMKKVVSDKASFELAKQLNLKNIYVSVIKDWFVHNNMDTNKFQPSKYQEEMKQLCLNANAEILPAASLAGENYLKMQIENNNYLNGQYIKRNHINNKKAEALNEPDAAIYKKLSIKDYDELNIEVDERYGEMKNIYLKEREYRILHAKYFNVNELLNKVSYIIAGRKGGFKGSYFAYINKIAINEKWKLREEIKLDEDKKKFREERDEQIKIEQDIEIEKERKREAEDEIKKIAEDENISYEEAKEKYIEKQEKLKLKIYRQKKLLLGEDESYYEKLEEKYKGEDI